MTFSAISVFVLLSFLFSQSEQPYPPVNLVSIPTAGTMPKGYFSFKTSIPIWLREKLFLKNMLTKELRKISKNFNSKNLLFTEHHFSHAASAFYPSPYEKAIVLTLDGVGGWATSTVSIGEKNNLQK